MPEDELYLNPPVSPVTLTFLQLKIRYKEAMFRDICSKGSLLMGYEMIVAPSGRQAKFV
jgi:hypothetical protein